MDESLFCDVCSQSFRTPQGRAGHQSHRQDPAHRAAYDARKSAKNHNKNRRPAVENQPAEPENHHQDSTTTTTPTTSPTTDRPAEERRDEGEAAQPVLPTCYLVR